MLDEPFYLIFLLSVLDLGYQFVYAHMLKVSADVGFTYVINALHLWVLDYNHLYVQARRRRKVHTAGICFIDHFILRILVAADKLLVVFS